MKDKMMDENGGVGTPAITGALVIGAVILLWAIRRGFRGVNLAGLSVGMR